MFNIFCWSIFAFAITLSSGLKLPITKNEKVDTGLKTSNNADYLLPKTFIPKNYDISFKVDLDEFKFYGTVNIDIEALEETDKITLHSKNLRIKRIELKDSKHRLIQIDTVYFDEKRDFLTIPTRTNLKSSQRYNLLIKYEGRLEDETDGFYRSSYLNNKGEKV